jgi:hypothetical protein
MTMILVTDLLIEVIEMATIDKTYEEDFKNQPLYCNKFQLNDSERAKYLEQVPDWVERWQQELDKVYSD